MKRVCMFVVLFIMLSSLAVVSAPSNASENIRIKTPRTLTSHDPIHIDGNSDFAVQASSEGWQGNGSEENPYVIENYDINAGSRDGIDIKNTDVYFVIRHCVVHGGKNNNHGGISFCSVTYGAIDNVTLYNNYFAIWLSYPSNNNLITNCTLYNHSYRGILLSSSSNNTISSCMVYNNDNYGIELDFSSNNTISNCNVYSNDDYGVHLSSSSNNNIINCAVYNNHDGLWLSSSSNNNQISDCAVYNNDNYGIYLDKSLNNTLRKNTLSNNLYNFGIYGENIFEYCQDIDTSNTINGKNIYYFVGQNELVLDSNDIDIGYLGLISCSRITVKNLNLTQSAEPLLLINTSYSNIINCTVYNSWSGLPLRYSSNNNQISNCAIYNNIQGIHIYESSENTITNCSVYNNSNDGIHLWSSSNNNRIANCTVYNNSWIGIWLRNSSNNQITYSTISKNGVHGILIQENSNDNFIHHNNFIDNYCFDGCSNHWDDGSEGNYWSDYIGIDANGDGIGDTPYYLDRYPLMNPIGEPAGKPVGKPIKVFLSAYLIWIVAMVIVIMVVAVVIMFALRKRRKR